MKISFWKKLSVCALAGFLCLFTLHTDVNHHLPVWLPEIVITILAFIIFTLSLLYIFIWQFLERKNKIDSQQTLAFWQRVIIYCEALVFLRFGFLKLFGLHMNPSMIMEDFPAGTMSGYHLMDYFFGRAPEFKILIGSLQIIGAMALLWGRTRLLGIFILVPVILNIVCMDLFYNVGEGITIVAVFLLLGLSYLLFQEKEKFLDFFFKTKSAMPIFIFENSFKKNLLRITAVAATLALLIPSIHPLKNASIIGKYSMENLQINGKPVVHDLNNDSLLTDIYFDENETCLLRYNNYKSIKIGKAIYDEPDGKLTVIWRFPKNQKDTSFWNLLGSTRGDKLLLSGNTGKETIQATLTKTKLATVLFH